MTLRVTRPGVRRLPPYMPESHQNSHAVSHSTPRRVLHQRETTDILGAAQGTIKEDPDSAAQRARGGRATALTSSFERRI